MAVFMTLLPVLAVCLFLLYFAPRLVSFWRYLLAVEKLPSAHGRLPIFGHALQLAIPRNQIVSKMEEIHEKNKSPFVIWGGPIPVLLLTDPKHVEVILGSAKHTEKLYEYHFIESWLGKGLLTKGGSQWAAQRKMITPAFHFKILENFMVSFIEKSKILVKKLEKEIGSPSFDAFPYVTMCAVDIICATAMGINEHAQEMNQQSEYIETISRITDELMHRVLSPWLYPDVIYKLTPNGRRVAKYINILHEKARKIIKEHKEQYTRKMSATSAEDAAEIGTKKKLAFLDLLLENSETGKKLSDEEIREEVDTFMFGGHDTVSSLLSWALQMLSSYRKVQEKAYEEQENIFQGSDRVPNTKDLSEMKYLESVIKETLRMYPSAVFLVGRLKKMWKWGFPTRQIEVTLYPQRTAEVDFCVLELKSIKALEYRPPHEFRALRVANLEGGYRLPAGMRVAFIPYVTHRLEEYYLNPNVFDPERFLPENFSNRHPYSYIPFSSGPRNCIGQKFAMLETKTVLSYILRHYKLEATGEISNPVPEIVLRPENGVHIKITKRNTSLDG